MWFNLHKFNFLVFFNFPLKNNWKNFRNFMKISSIIIWGKSERRKFYWQKNNKLNFCVEISPHFHFYYPWRGSTDEIFFVCEASWPKFINFYLWKLSDGNGKWLAMQIEEWLGFSFGIKENFFFEFLENFIEKFYVLFLEF